MSNQITKTASSEATAETRKQRQDRWRAPKTASNSDTKVRDQLSRVCSPINHFAICWRRAG